MNKKNKNNKQELVEKYSKHLPQILLKVGTELFAGVAVGVFIGITLDNYFQKSPMFIIIFFFLGCAAGFLNVFNAIKQNQGKF